MRLPNFIGGTGEGRSKNFVADRTINLFPELGAAGTGKNGELAMLARTPGLTRLVTAGNGPNRACYMSSVGRAFVVSGNTLYELDAFWTATSRGTLTSSTGRVGISDNGLHLMIVDGTNGWTFTFSTDTFAQITDADFPGAAYTAFIDGYFVFNEPGTGRFWITASYDATDIDPLDFATSEGSPDIVRRVETLARYLWVFNQQTIEVYWDSGDTFPFSRVENAFLEIGCAAGATVEKLNNALFWLSESKEGAGIVYKGSASSLDRISTHEIEIELRRRGSLGTATAWSHLYDGHPVYCLNLGTGNPTLCYDDATGVWHETASLENGVLKRHRAENHMYAFGKHVTGDYENGRIYEIDPSALDYDGSEIKRLRRVPHVAKDGHLIFVGEMELEMEPGLGLDGVPTTTAGYDPKVMLRISRDGGHTWGNERWRSAGKRGETTHRARWNRCGKARDFVFEFSMTDPVDLAWVGANFEPRKGRS